MTGRNIRFEIFLRTLDVTEEEWEAFSFPRYLYSLWVGLNTREAHERGSPSVTKTINGITIVNHDAFDRYIEHGSISTAEMRQDIERWRAAQKVTTLSKTPPSLKEAQHLVGGQVEMVRLPDGRQMLVNEEGLLYRLPYNAKASGIAGHPIAGPVVILEGSARWT